MGTSGSRRFDARSRWSVLIGTLSILVALVTVAPVASPPVVAEPASAEEPASISMGELSGSSFNAGNIITDYQFYQRDALTQAEIQSFLDAKIGSCGNSNCLNVYRMSTFSRAQYGTVCNAYAGATNERAAAIIYKVQAACGISAKVLLATLQKEEGLVTSTAPSAGRLQIAMGYGCPDTAACDSKYYGFYNQLYNAAWQLKRYSTPNPVGNYQPGVRSILYNPNHSCGAKTVTIANNATAALYNYTPYTPNSAALANLYGAAPPCGSYGNRNFWVYYNSWFAPTVADAKKAISAAYAADPTVATDLGAAAGAVICAKSVYSCYQYYVHGVIYWTNASGAVVASGAFGDLFRAAGGVTGKFGPPLGVQTDVTDPNGNGVVQKFQNGWLHSSAVGTFFLRTATMTAYSAAGWLRGSLGWPNAPEDCTGPTGTACIQTFAGGGVIVTPVSGLANVMDPSIQAFYQGLGGTHGSLGYPVNATAAVTDPNGNGAAEKFQHGWIHTSTAGTFTSSNAVMTAYSAAGWLRGPLGWPTSAELCGPTGTGCIQEFAGGAVVVPASGAAAVMDPTILAEYKAGGGTAGPLGYPVTVSAAVADPHGNGATQRFQHGWIHSGDSGTFTVDAATMSAYSAAGWLRGFLGWPTAEASCAAGTCTQTFSGGEIRTTAGQRSLVVPAVSDPNIATAYAAAGGETSWLGAPTAPMSTVADKNGAGVAQRFLGGWIHSSAKGTFVSSTTIMTAYSAAGWVRGKLGWPTGAETCSATACSQPFAGGTIKVAIPATPAVSNAAIKALYLSLGGAGGSLGRPLTAVSVVTDKNGNGFAQKFEGGWIHSSAKGTFASGPAIMKAYSKAGWVRGTLGWPTASQVCDAVACTQTFTGGTLTAK